MTSIFLAQSHRTLSVGDTVGFVTATELLGVGDATHVFPVLIRGSNPEDAEFRVEPHFYDQDELLRHNVPPLTDLFTFDLLSLQEERALELRNLVAIPLGNGRAVVKPLIHVTPEDFMAYRRHQEKLSGGIHGHA